MNDGLKKLKLMNDVFAILSDKPDLKLVMELSELSIEELKELLK